MFTLPALMSAMELLFSRRALAKMAEMACWRIAKPMRMPCLRVNAPMAEKHRTRRSPERICRKRDEVLH